MKVALEVSALAETKWHEYLVRFVLGGLVTVIAGIIGTKFGPKMGGLFLAFPAILPASLTLIEKHLRKRMKNDGEHGQKQGEKAAALDCMGASLGLVAFGIVVWHLAPVCAPAMVLIAASFAWAVVAVGAWWVRIHT